MLPRYTLLVICEVDSNIYMMSLTAPFVLVKFLFDIQIKFSRCFTPGLMMDWNLHDELFRIFHSFFLFDRNWMLCWHASLPHWFASIQLTLAVRNGKISSFYAHSLQRCRSVVFSWSFLVLGQQLFPNKASHAPYCKKKCTSISPKAITVKTIIWCM